jgi:hypothetical protein
LRRLRFSFNAAASLASRGVCDLEPIALSFA